MEQQRGNQLPIFIASEENAREKLAKFVLTLGVAQPERLTDRLVQKCGAASRVFGAPRYMLDGALGPHHRVTKALRTARWLSLHAFENRALEQPIFACRRALAAYLGTALAHERQETVRVIFVTSKLRLIAAEVIHRGTRHACDVDLSLVLRRALELGAGALLLVHNHPSGDPTPSTSDLQLTAKMAEAFRAFDVHLIDHVVVGRNGVKSAIWEGPIVTRGPWTSTSVLGL